MLIPGSLFGFASTDSLFYLIICGCSTIQKGPAAPSKKEQLQKLVDKLEVELKSIPAEHKDAAEVVSKRTTALIEEASDSDGDPASVKSKANRLQLAADNIKEVLPTVALIGASIVTQVLKMAGH